MVLDEITGMGSNTGVEEKYAQKNRKPGPGHRLPGFSVYGAAGKQTDYP